MKPRGSTTLPTMAEPDDGPAAQRSEDPHLALPGQSGARGGRAAMSRGLVKNRSAAAIQISAEQLLREARDRQIDTHAAAPPRQHVADAEELADFCRSKRKEFEDKIRMQRQHIGTYIQYAAWEESQHEFERARSVFERALDMEYQNNTTWMKYAEFEMRNKFVNHARNIWDRAVQLLPRHDLFWYKYSYMEEILGEPALARAVFERWMKWEPDDNGWNSFVKFEVRQDCHARARSVMERYVACHATLRAYLKYAKWEEKLQQLALARAVYERALVELPTASETGDGAALYSAFAQFEERCREYDRARVVYKYALDNLGRENAPELLKAYLNFEKKNGTPDAIEVAIVSKRRRQYEARVAAEPHDYDAWFDFCRLNEAEGTVDEARDTYERAIANVPPSPEKRHWRRYIYLWIKYALYEELGAPKDRDRARQVLVACLNVIPHQAFSFAKIWLMLAHLEVRCRNLGAARKTLGRALGKTAALGKEKLFKGYIALERQLGEVDRCRALYARYLETQPANCVAWVKFAELEAAVGEVPRCRAVYELAIQQPQLDMPEALWKAYIDYEIGLCEAGGAPTAEDSDDEDGGDGGAAAAEAAAEAADGRRVRALYGRLLERTTHVKVWISHAAYEAAAAGGGGPEAARQVYRRANDLLREEERKEERVQLLEAWRAAEKASTAAAAEAAVKEVEGMMPRKLKKRRMVTGDDGEAVGWEEFFDYVFPDEAKPAANLKLLEMAAKWKAGNAAAAAAPKVGEKRPAEEEAER